MVVRSLAKRRRIESTDDAEERLLRKGSRLEPRYCTRVTVEIRNFRPDLKQWIGKGDACYRLPVSRVRESGVY